MDAKNNNNKSEPVMNQDKKNPDQEKKVDVEEIMQEIRETIAQKKKMGLYSDEEIEEVAKLKLETFADSAEIDMQLLRYLRAENRLWNISSDYQIQSHRGRYARLIVWAKKLVRPFVRLYTDHIIERQAQLNIYTVHILHNQIRELTKLHIENTQLRHRLEVLEREHRFLLKRERTLEDMVVYRDEKEEEAKTEPKQKRASENEVEAS